jgi:hypothetical protein
MTNTKIISRSEIKTASFVLLFTALAVTLPMFLHQLAGPVAGRLFLPMHLFIFVAALLLGWRSGLIVGILTPLVSFSLTGMPIIAVLPLIIVETSLYGFLTGYFYKTKGWNILYSLLGAMVLARIILFLAIAILPIKISAASYIFSALNAGFIGIAIQLILAPLVYKSLETYISNEKI